MALPPGIRRGDHEEIEQRGRLAEVEKHDVLGPVVVGDPGREPGVLERLVDPVWGRADRRPGWGCHPGRPGWNGRGGLSAALEASKRGGLLHRWGVLSHSSFPKSRMSAGRGRSMRVLDHLDHEQFSTGWNDLLDTPGNSGSIAPDLECNRTMHGLTIARASPAPAACSAAIVDTGVHGAGLQLEHDAARLLFNRVQHGLSTSEGVGLHAEHSGRGSRPLLRRGDPARFSEAGWAGLGRSCRCRSCFAPRRPPAWAGRTRR